MEVEKEKVQMDFAPKKSVLKIHAYLKKIWLSRCVKFCNETSKAAIFFNWI
jgi:hypothetical protein